jgi:alpha-aminoadipate/glutamate carrier protein LysW
MLALPLVRLRRGHALPAGLDAGPQEILKDTQGRVVHRFGGFMVLCPECETDLDIEEDEVDEGEIVSCPECGTDFEVVTTNPLELNPIEEEEEAKEEEEEEDGDYS